MSSNVYTINIEIRNVPNRVETLLCNKYLTNCVSAEKLTNNSEHCGVSEVAQFFKDFWSSRAYVQFEKRFLTDVLCDDM